MSLEALVEISLLLLYDPLHLPLLVLFHLLLLLRKVVILIHFLLPLIIVRLFHQLLHWCFPQLCSTSNCKTGMLSLYLSNQQVLLCPHEIPNFPFFHLLFWCSICFWKLWSASHLLVFLSIAHRDFCQCCFWTLIYFKCELLYALPMSKTYLSIWNPLALFEPFPVLSCSLFQQLHSVEVS